MKSRAHVKGHPLHPILVNFPIAFFTGTLAFDVLANMFHVPSFSNTALYLQVAGITFSIFAAIPGLIDYIYTIPPESTAKSRAAQHGLLNVTVVALFTGGLFYRLLVRSTQPFVLMGTELLGVAILGVAGWMGGTLVTRNQIGIDIRYAGAGKWKEIWSLAQEGVVKLDDLPDLKEDQMVLLHVAGKRIVIAKTEGQIVAFDDKCSHRGGSLAAGVLICGTVQCPWHGSQFDTGTGEIKAGPAQKKIETYLIKKEKERLFLYL